MGKIRKVNIKPIFKEGEGKGVPNDAVWETNLMYSTKSKLFYIAIPDEWKDFMPTDRNVGELVSKIGIRSQYTLSPAFSGTVEEDVIRKASRYFAAFLLEKPEIIKTILYKFGTTIGNNDSHEHDRHDKVEFDFIVAERQVFGSKITYTHEYERHDRFSGENKTYREDVSNFIDGGSNRGGWYNQGGYKWMEWTQEREDYFTDLRAGLRVIIKSMEEVASNNEGFKHLIDSGATNLLAMAASDD